MASEDLLKKAFAAFKALSPEQQAEMLEEQRQSWVRGNVGLSRDERGMTSPMMRALKIVRETNDKGRQALKAWADSKTRPAPAATDTGLVRYAHDNGTLSGLSRNEHGPWCLHYQAAELLAAERADKRIWMEKAAIEAERVERLEADNAALTARVKELSEALETEKNLSRGDWACQRDVDQMSIKVEALEAKLAAAEKVREAAIELDEAISDDFNIFGAQQKLRAALGGKPS